MTEPTAINADWSVGGLTKLGAKPGGGVAAGILDSGTPGGNWKDIVEWGNKRRSKAISQRCFLPNLQSAGTVGGKTGYLECLDASFDR